MHTHRARLAALTATWILIVGCEGASSSTDAATARDASDTGRLPGCTLTDRTRCPLGAVCPAGDGCNSARCDSDGGLGTTLIGCAGYCRTSADCIPGMSCFFSDPQSCQGAPGICRPSFSSSGCTTQVELCDCAGRAWMTCEPAGFRLSGRGPCVPRDAGAPDADSCEGGELAADRSRCFGESDRELDPACCAGWLCDARRAFCDVPEPRCPTGQHITVSAGCWGPCVPRARCDEREGVSVP